MKRLFRPLIGTSEGRVFIWPRKGWHNGGAFQASFGPAQHPTGLTFMMTPNHPNSKKSEERVGASMTHLCCGHPLSTPGVWCIRNSTNNSTAPSNTVPCIHCTPCGCHLGCHGHTGTPFPSGGTVYALALSLSLSLSLSLALSLALSLTHTHRQSRWDRGAAHTRGRVPPNPKRALKP